MTRLSVSRWKLRKNPGSAARHEFVKNPAANAMTDAPAHATARRRRPWGQGPSAGPGDRSGSCRDTTSDYIDTSGGPVVRSLRTPPPRLAVTDDEVDDCRHWVARRGVTDEPLVVVQTCSRNLKRGRWPRDRWRRAIAEILSSLPGGRVILAGAPEEGAEVHPLAAALEDPRVAVATDDLPLRRLFALLTMAHSCVSLDSGPAHAAAALGCPLVVLTGMADPRRCQPRPDRAPLEVVASIPRNDWPDDPHEWQCRNRMEEIGVDAVLEAWHRAVGAQSSTATA